MTGEQAMGMLFPSDGTGTLGSRGRTVGARRRPQPPFNHIRPITPETTAEENDRAKVEELARFTANVTAEATAARLFEQIGQHIHAATADHTRWTEEILEEQAYYIEREADLLDEIASLQAALASYRHQAEAQEVQMLMKSEERVSSIPILHTGTFVLAAILLTSGLLCLASAAGRAAVPPAVSMLGILCGVCLVGTTLLSLRGRQMVDNEH